MPYVDGFVLPYDHKAMPFDVKRMVYGGFGLGTRLVHSAGHDGANLIPKPSDRPSSMMRYATAS